MNTSASGRLSLNVQILGHKVLSINSSASLSSCVIRMSGAAEVRGKCKSDSTGALCRDGVLPYGALTHGAALLSCAQVGLC